MWSGGGAVEKRRGIENVPFVKTGFSAVNGSLNNERAMLFHSQPWFASHCCTVLSLPHLSFLSREVFKISPHRVVASRYTMIGIVARLTLFNIMVIQQRAD